MGFHSQTFSDISLHTHRPLTSFLFILEKPKGVGSEVSMRIQFLEKPISHDHFREKNQKILHKEVDITFITVVPIYL
jgi:hypothetical protein